MIDKLKYVAAYIPGWGFYWVGDLVSKLMHCKMEFLYPVYSLFMSWSVFFNDWGGLDVWIESKNE